MHLLFLNLGAQELSIMLPLMALFIYTLYHAITNKYFTSNQRILWIVLILLTNLIGWVAYWVLEKNGDTRERSRTN